MTDIKLFFQAHVRIILGIIGVIVLGVVVFFLRKGVKHSQEKYQVNISVSNNLHTYTAVNYYTSQDMINFRISNFIPKAVSPHVPISMNYVNWTSVYINQKQVDPSSDQSLLAFFNSNIPHQITLTGTFTHLCPDHEKPDCANFCHPCDGCLAVCDPISGWQCKKGMMCPNDAILKTCCEDSKDGPIAKCDPTTKQLSCSFCDLSEKPDCSQKTDTCDPCKGCDAVCTPDGWICANNQKCPTQEVQDRCCTSITDYPTCNEHTNFEVVCSECQGDSPSCPEKCTGDGLACNKDTKKWECNTGVKCPSDNILKTCCQDPNKPVAVCSNGKVTCTACSGTKPTTPCGPTCNGKDWVCTNNGWECLPNQKCPDLDWAKKNGCCPYYLVPKCGANNTIECVCPDGTVECGEGENKICCENKCCTNDPPAGCPAEKCCNKGIDGKYLCCDDDKICATPQGQSFCCPDGTKCDEGECIAQCGVDSLSNPVFCKKGEKCIIISNLLPSRADYLKKKYGDKIRIDGTTAHMCTASTDCCITDQNELAVPDAIQNYYSCTIFPENDEDNLYSYCSGKNDSDLIYCLERGDKTSCDGDQKCTWINPLEYVSQSSQDFRKNAEKIDRDLRNISGFPNRYGNYCDPSNGGEEFSRLVAFQLEQNPNCKDVAGDTCLDPTTCLNLMAQPNVVDVYYDENSKICAAMQSCNRKDSGLQSTLRYVFNNQIIKEEPNPDARDPLRNENTSFPKCNPDLKCPITDTSLDIVCDIPTGTINQGTANIEPVNLPQPRSPSHCESALTCCGKAPTDATKCVNVTDGTGKISHSCTNADWSCGSGFVKSSDGKCYQDYPMTDNRQNMDPYWRHTGDLQRYAYGCNVPAGRYALKQNSHAGNWTYELADGNSEYNSDGLVIGSVDARNTVHSLIP